MVLTNVPFNFILPLIPKEIDSLNNITISKDTNKERIYRTERSLAEVSLDNQLIDNDIKKSKQDIETEIPYLIAFLYGHQYIVQEKEFNRKHTKDRTILTSSFSQYDRTERPDNLTNKIIIDDILAPFEVISDTYIIDASIK